MCLEHIGGKHKVKDLMIVERTKILLHTKKESYDHVKVIKLVLPAQLLLERRIDPGIKPTPLKHILTKCIW